jgi:hypothetical protein
MRVGGEARPSAVCVDSVRRPPRSVTLSSATEAPQRRPKLAALSVFNRGKNGGLGRVLRSCHAQSWIQRLEPSDRLLKFLNEFLPQLDQQESYALRDRFVKPFEGLQRIPLHSRCKTFKHFESRVRLSSFDFTDILRADAGIIGKFSLGESRCCCNARPRWSRSGLGTPGLSGASGGDGIFVMRNVSLLGCWLSRCYLSSAHRCMRTRVFRNVWRGRKTLMPDAL